jgi:hypothetical protein
MTTTDFTTTLLVDQSPIEVFEAIKNVRGWWSGLFAEEFEGDSNQIGDEFTFLAGEGVHYTKQKLVELIPNQKVVWLVTDSKLTFVENQTEWTGTKLCFELSTVDNQTKIVFTHIGLIPTFECYDSCAPAWTQYMQERLLNFLNTSTIAKQETPTA